MGALPTSDAGTARRHRLVWIYRARTDLLISLCWVPLFVIGHQLAIGSGSHADARVRWIVAAALFVSFLHQPLTFALVYGDRRQFQQRRNLFLWAPPITIAVIAIAVALHLWVVIPIAALWNTIHTLQQRYGLSRIYARRSKYGSAWLDRWVLYAWMTSTVLVVASRRETLRLVQRVGLAGVNGAGVRLLTDARPVAVLLLIPVGAAALVLAAAIVRQEVAAGEGANPAKWLYQGASLILIASIAVDPIAGFTAYVGAHAIEYAVVVYKTAESRYGGQRDRSTLLGQVAWSPWGRVAAMAVAAFGALAVASRLHGDTANVALFTVGALHFLYDGFIWKLRKPAVAADFAIRT
ncbi:MAG: hypothetical protein QOF30_2810 [Acidimicrobiaceae bacterium]|jgi:hypothetical protein|nr:hypothetical protein [Acidimicrobiaceae bacterium]